MPMLQGVRVLDLSRVIAGPFCSRMLSDLGAEVIKIESADGDAFRRSVPQKGGFSAPFTQFNAGKKSVCINLRSAEGIALTGSLAKRCDVFLENFRAGLVGSMGLGYDDIVKLNPGIIYCSISGFGQDGPDAGRPAYTDIIQALSGLDYAAQNMHGNRSAEPPGFPVALADTCTSLNATIAILAALYNRTQTGAGQYVDMSMLDATVASNDSTLQRFIHSDGQDDAPSAIYRPPLRLKDGFMAASIGLNFEKSMQAIGREDLLEDARFKTVALQRQNMAEFVAEVQRWAAGRTVAEVSALFDEFDIPYGKVTSNAELVASGPLRSRGMLVDLDLPGSGPTPVLGTPFNFSSGRSQPAGPPPGLGEHTNAVLGELLGLSAAELERLAGAGVVTQGESA